MVARVTHGNSTKQPSNTTFAEHQTAPAASKRDTPRVSGVPIRRPRRAEQSRSRHQRTAKHLQSAAVHSRLTDRTPSSIDRRRCSYSQYSRRFAAIASTKRYAVAADVDAKAGVLAGRRRAHAPRACGADSVQPRRLGHSCVCRRSCPPRARCTRFGGGKRTEIAGPPPRRYALGRAVHPRRQDVGRSR